MSNAGWRGEAGKAGVGETRGRGDPGSGRPGVGKIGARKTRTGKTMLAIEGARALGLNAIGAVELTGGVRRVVVLAPEFSFQQGELSSKFSF